MQTQQSHELSTVHMQNSTPLSGKAHNHQTKLKVTFKGTDC